MLFDPIISVSEAFFADANPNKVNLGIGIYCDDSGKVPVLKDGDFVIYESLAMMAYLDRKYPEPPLFGVEGCHLAQALGQEVRATRGAPRWRRAVACPWPRRSLPSSTPDR